MKLAAPNFVRKKLPKAVSTWWGGVATGFVLGVGAARIGKSNTVNAVGWWMERQYFTRFGDEKEKKLYESLPEKWSEFGDDLAEPDETFQNEVIQ